jgi:invasion protein IalB
MTAIPRAVQIAAAALVIFAAGIAVGWFLHNKPSGGRAEVPTEALYDGWRLACPSASQMDKPCVLSNDLVDSKTNARIAQLAIVPAKSGTVLAITAPFDVLLPPGLGLGFGNDKPHVYAYRTCNYAGCIVEIPLDDALKSSFENSANGKLLLASLSGKLVSISFSLSGFPRAEKALLANQKGAM